MNIIPVSLRYNFTDILKIYNIAVIAAEKDVWGKFL